MPPRTGSIRHTLLVPGPDPLLAQPDGADCRWHPYPSDVALDSRRRCEFPGCGRPGELVRVCTPGMSAAMTPLFGNFATLITVWCTDDARGQGFDGSLAEEESRDPSAPHHHHAFRQWLKDHA